MPCDGMDHQYTLSPVKILTIDTPTIILQKTCGGDVYYC